MRLALHWVLSLALSVFIFSGAVEAKNKHKKNRDEIYDPRDRNEGYRDKHLFPDQNGDLQVDEKALDKDLVKAVENQRRVNFVEGGGMEVVRLLPDDNSGLKHQKWMVRLSNGKLMQAVYNSDMCPRVPLKVGDIVSMGGMFIWTNQGGLLHWLHHDPRKNRPDGYVELNGTYYCK